MAKSDILAAIKLVPDLADADEDYLNLLIDIAVETVRTRLNVPVFPFLSSGTSVSGPSPSTDISSEPTDDFLINFDRFREPFVSIDLVLSNCTTGDLTAAEMQTQIRSSVSTTDRRYPVFSRATVVYANSLYTISSPTYGPYSSVCVLYENNNADVVAALALGAKWSGVELPGASENVAMSGAVERLVENAYRKFRQDPQIYEDVPQQAVSRAFKELDDMTKGIIDSKRGMNI